MNVFESCQRTRGCAWDGSKSVDTLAHLVLLFSRLGASADSAHC